MDKKSFQKKLQEFVTEKAGSLSGIEEIEEFFREENLTKEQTAMILEYVDQKRREKSLSSREEEYLREYLASLDSLSDERSEEKRWLAFAAREAVKYHSAGTVLEDLIQEGSLGLSLGLRAAAGAADPDEIIKESIRRQLSQASEESATAQISDRRMVERVKALDESLTKLEKELGRKVYPEEIADDMGISEDEVRSIIKLTGEDAGEEGGTKDAGA